MQTDMAPEVLQNIQGSYDGKLADIWSCGVMLYVMLFGRYPFDAPPVAAAAAVAAGGTPQDIRQRQMQPLILAAKWSIPQDVPISRECFDLLQRLLVADPAKRLTMAQITHHPWFTTNLPADALKMNDDCINSPDYTGAYCR